MGGVHGNLGVVPCDHATGAYRLDAAVGIGEVALCPIRRTTILIALRLAALHHARRWARPIVIWWRRLLGFSLQCCFGSADTLEPRRLVGDPGRHLVTTLVRAMNAVLLDILRLGTREPVGHLGGKPLLCLAHTSIRHRLVHAGISLNFGTVERHMAELDQPCRPTQLEHLYEQLAQSLQVPLPERGDSPEVRTVQRGYGHEVDAFLARLRDLA